MATLMSRYGTRWRDAIPTPISAELKSRRDQLRTRTYLDVESSDNVVWLLTLEELRQMLISPKLWPAARELTRLQKSDVASRVEELREIRNVIGHNRATTSRTIRVFEGIEEYLSKGIEHFRDETLYYRAEEILTAPDPHDPLSAAIADLWDGKKRQVFLERTKKFSAVMFLPVPPFTLISIPDLLETFHDVRHLILALYVNARANEFSVVWPRTATSADDEAILASLATFHHFTEIEYANQDPKYICDPRIWFYVDERFRPRSQD